MFALNKMFVALGLAISSSYVFFDMSYFLRFAYMCLRSISVKPHAALLEDCVVNGICWTSDIDFMLHMNNARYLRECDFARFKLMFDTGITAELRRIGGSLVVASSTIRYRKSVRFLERFQVRSRVLCWDDRAFYVEQRIERAGDRFICAIVILKQTVTGVTMDELLNAKYGHDAPTSPETLEEVQLFIDCHQKSSEMLRRGQ